MNIATTDKTRLPALNLEVGPVYSSFEKFRKGGVGSLASIVPGTVGTLCSKNDQYKILVDSDFQALLGLATEVHRLRQRLTYVISAAKIVVRHSDDVSIEHLKATISMINEPTDLPVRNDWDPITLEDSSFELDPGDEVELDNIPRPF